VLFTHLVPHNIIVGKESPAPTDLGCFAKRCGVEVAEDLESKFWGKEGEKVDIDHVPHLYGEKGELRKAAGGEDALKDEVSLLGRSGREDGPDVGYALLVGLRKGTEFLVECKHESW
jgi:hypothetical protein